MKKSKIPTASERGHTGETMMDFRYVDGRWNYGSPPIFRQDELALNKGSSANQRLRAARISARMATAGQAAELLKVNAASYTAWEAGRRTPPPDLLAKAAVTFGVTLDYLEDGWVVNAGDEFAVRAERLLYHDERTFDPQAAATRLRRVRSKGYRTAKGAATANGWSVPTYVGHESGTRALPLDRAILYSITLGVRPEHVLFGEPAQKDLRWMLASGAKFGLKAGRGLESAFFVPLFEYVEGKLVSHPMPIVAPTHLFSELLQFSDELMGVVVRRTTGFDAWLVAPAPSKVGRGDPEVYVGPLGPVIIQDEGPRATKGMRRLGVYVAALTLSLHRYDQNSIGGL